MKELWAAQGLCLRIDKNGFHECRGAKKFLLHISENFS